MSEHLRWRSARRNKEHKSVRSAFAGAELPSLERGVIVTLTRVGGRRVDTDRLAGALYACRDAVAAMYRTDDSHRSPIAWVYRQHVELVREAHRIPARAARAGDSMRGVAARAARPARIAQRFRVWLRVVIETAVEHADSRCDRRCDD
jgi:hypothetical protein